MDITRRQLFVSLISIPFIKRPSFINWKPHPKQLEFMRNTGERYYPFYGVPYHHSNASTDTWLGIKRQK